MMKSVSLRLILILLAWAASTLGPQTVGHAQVIELADEEPVIMMVLDWDGTIANIETLEAAFSRKTAKEWTIPSLRVSEVIPKIQSGQGVYGNWKLELDDEFNGTYKYYHDQPGEN